MHRLALAMLAISLSAGPALAQRPQDSWDNLKQLQPGHKVQVVDTHLKSWKGELVGVSEESITIRTKEGEITVDRGELFRVTDMERSKRGRNALLGLLIGAAIGAPVGAGTASDLPKGWAAAAVGVFFGGMGAGVGALVPSYPVIYKSQYGPTKASSEKPGP